jgi:hypothetical protein
MLIRASGRPNDLYAGQYKTLRLAMVSCKQISHAASVAETVRDGELVGVWRQLGRAGVQADTLVDLDTRSRPLCAAAALLALLARIGCITTTSLCGQA